MADQKLTGKVTAASRAYAKGLQPAPAVNGSFTEGFAVDVQLDGSAAYAAGVIVRYFKNRADADAMVAGINSGNFAVTGASKAGWYAKRNARNARVTRAYAVPVGKSAVDVLKSKASASKRASKRASKAVDAPASPATMPQALPQATA